MSFSVRRGVLRACARILISGGVALAWAAAADEPKLPPGYAGSEICGTCHEDTAKAFAKNPHAVLDTEKKRGWQARSCEGCHGPGAKHADSASADDIINPKNEPGLKADRSCLGCHQNQEAHSGRIASGHARSQVACTACHTIHASGADSLHDRFRSTDRVNKLCSSCHTAVWASFQKPHKHRLPEGSMSCVDCHNPHGSFLGRQMNTTAAGEPGCFRCHSDKRGPFLFQHAPVRTEPCSSCHEPHGSTNPRMLTRSNVTFLCLECHSNIVSPSAAGTVGSIPPAFHDLRSPRYRNCVACHQKTHGSNVNKGFLR